MPLTTKDDSEDGSMNPPTDVVPKLYGEEEEKTDEVTDDKKTKKSEDDTHKRTAPDVFEACFNDYPKPLFLIDIQTDIIFLWNTAARDKFGFTQEEAIGRNLSIILPEQSLTAAKIGISQRAIAKSKSGKNLKIELDVFKVNSTNPSLIGGVLNDITKETNLISDLKSSNDKLLKIQKQFEYQNARLVEYNAVLYQAKQEAEYRMARAQSQDIIANRLLFLIFTVIGGTVLLSSFTRVPDASLSFVKDSSLLLLGILSASVSGIFGNKEEKSLSNSREYQNPVAAPRLQEKEEPMTSRSSTHSVREYNSSGSMPQSDIRSNINRPDSPGNNYNSASIYPDNDLDINDQRRIVAVNPDAEENEYF